MKFFIITFLSFFTSAIVAQSTNHYNLEKGLAIQGYDPVAYFSQNKAVKGTTGHTYTYKGAKYQFANAENKAAFMANPGKYEPQYGGWCAYAMGATGEKVEIDPEKFKITDGKLYLFYHSWTNNTLSKWIKDEKGLKQKADENWKKFTGK
jgi:YHS domain-containing protein